MTTKDPAPMISELPELPPADYSMWGYDASTVRAIVLADRAARRSTEVLALTQPAVPVLASEPEPVAAEQAPESDAELAAIIRGMVALTHIGWAPDLRFDDDGHWKVQSDTFCEHPWHNSPAKAWEYFVRVQLEGYEDAKAALASQSTPPPESAGQGLSDAEIDAVIGKFAGGCEWSDDQHDSAVRLAKAILAANRTAQQDGGSKA